MARGGQLEGCCRLTYERAGCATELGRGVAGWGSMRGRISAWHGSMPGNHAQVGLIRLFGGRSSAARTTFSLNAWSYVVRFFLPAPPEGGVGRMSDER